MSFLRGETAADIKKAKVRTERELLLATTAHSDANLAYDVALEDCADDDTMRALMDKQTTTSWQVNRVKKRLEALERRYAEQEAKELDALLRADLAEVIEAAEEFEKSARQHVLKAAKFIEKRSQIEAHGFRRQATEIENFPPFVIDYAQGSSATPDLSLYPALDRWIFGIAALKRRLVASAPEASAPAAPVALKAVTAPAAAPIAVATRPQGVT